MFTWSLMCSSMKHPIECCCSQGRNATTSHQWRNRAHQDADHWHTIAGRIGIKCSLVAVIDLPLPQHQTPLESVCTMVSGGHMNYSTAVHCNRGELRDYTTCSA